MKSILKSATPMVMGILNTTPDSFSDGGRFNLAKSALQHAEQLIEYGADIIDVGGESTRPGAEPVSLHQELDRVIPVIEQLAVFNVPISIDTSKAEVMREAMAAGACMINDVQALTGPGTIEAVKDTAAEVCLMHMLGKPRTMQKNPVYKNLLGDIYSFLEQRINVCLDSGIAREKICVDPGFGFGKKLQDNYSLLKNLRDFSQLKVPVLVGMSRKAMIGQVLDCEVEQRLIGSVSAALLAVVNGAKIVRVHDVKETVQALKIYKAMQEA